MGVQVRRRDGDRKLDVGVMEFGQAACGKASAHDVGVLVWHRDWDHCGGLSFAGALERHNRAAVQNRESTRHPKLAKIAGRCSVGLECYNRMRTPDAFVKMTSFSIGFHECLVKNGN